MTLKIEPKTRLDDMVKGEEISFSLDLTKELDGNTVKSHTFKVYDSAGEDVTNDFGGGSSVSESVLTFGVVAHELGKYTLEFWVTCNEFLPDGTTYYEFTALMTVKIKEK